MPPQKRKTKKGIRYRFDVVVKGQRLYSPTIYLTKQEARDAEAGVITAFLQGQKTPLTSADTSKETVLELLTRRLAWIKEHRSRAYFQITKTQLARALSFAPEWQGRYPSEITPGDVEKWAERYAADLIRRGKGKYEVNKSMIALQITWNSPWGRKRGPREYPVNPFSWSDRFPIEKKAIFIPSVEDAEKVLGAASGLGKIYLSIMVETGARPGEARNLKWEDVGAGHVILYTRKKIGGNLTPRRVPISEDLSLALKGSRTFHPDDVYVFQQREKAAPHVYLWAMKIQVKACKDAGVRYFKLHSWRHYHASKLADGKEFSLIQIQRRLGHEKATTTDRYLHEIKGV